MKINAGTANYLLYGGYDPFTVQITHILNQNAGLGWTSYSHTAVSVPISAIGVGAETFNGFYDNTDIGKKIMGIMGFEFKVAALLVWKIMIPLFLKNVDPIMVSLGIVIVLRGRLSFLPEA